jgi:4-amino-4-deoxy-L-arabinose transferase-like glycosyltransferase
MPKKTNINGYCSSISTNTTINDDLLMWLIGLTFIVNIWLVIYSIIPDHDPVLYGNIAKQIALTNDWSNLFFNHQDWLDKPHFPFWATALFFKLFGISSCTYFISGFIFYLSGAYFTYRLGTHLYHQRVGILATLFYLTTFHLLLSSIDLKAEAYLLGEIMPACYFWLLYQESIGVRWRYLFLGAFFTAFAMMTKGIFVLVTIFSGIGALGIYHAYLRAGSIYPKSVQQNSFLIKAKWLLALGLSFILIAPELVSLYWQFDAHPEKIIFSRTGVSGIRWFFWDSQIGRFFQTGPIVQQTKSFHYFFFVHALLWSLLPWTLFFIAALCNMVTTIRHGADHSAQAAVFLLGAFIPTFCMFSLSTFQLEHYINILFPFAAIMCAAWMDKWISGPHSVLQNRLLKLQVVLAFGLVVFGFLVFWLIHQQLPSWMLLVMLVVPLLFIIFIKQTLVFKSLVYSVMSILMVFILHMVLNHTIYTAYDPGYKIAQYLNHQAPLPVIEYKLNSWTFAFHVKNRMPLLADEVGELNRALPYYLVFKQDNIAVLKQLRKPYQIVMETSGIHFLTKPFTVVSNWLSADGMSPFLSNYLVVKVTPKLTSSKF